MHDFNTCHHVFIDHEKLICIFVFIWNKDKNTLTDVGDDTSDTLMIFIETPPRLVFYASWPWFPLNFFFKKRKQWKASKGYTNHEKLCKWYHIQLFEPKSKLKEEKSKKKKRKIQMTSKYKKCLVNRNGNFTDKKY